MTRMARQRSAHCRRVRQEKPRETKDLQSFGKEIKDSRELKKKKKLVCKVLWAGASG